MTAADELTADQPVSHGSDVPTEDFEDSDNEGQCAALPVELRAELEEVFKAAHDSDGSPSRRDAALSPHPSIASTTSPSRAAPGYKLAIASLQQLPRVFSPAEKLNLLHKTFHRMSEAVKTFWNQKVGGHGVNQIPPSSNFLSIDCHRSDTTHCSLFHDTTLILGRSG